MVTICLGDAKSIKLVHIIERGGVNVYARCYYAFLLTVDSAKK